MKLIDFGVVLFAISVANAKSCGRRSNVVGTIFGGNKALKNEWPWLVAFVDRQSESFFCCGSLISSKHVLSGEKIDH